MDSVSIKSRALSQLGATEYQVKPDLTVVYLEGNAVEPSDSDIDDRVALIEVQENRRKEYPSFADQFDDIFHSGIDAWKATIQVTKDKYPKP
jgi:hypothetical protein|tara:strand:+ start:1456 stop:1731 length:276 start_codon:yes stop_codon:yes gene_type:complete